MGCGCNKGVSGQPAVEYEVRFKDGARKRFTTSTEAQTAIRANGGGTMRAVRALSG